jgi:hypothetical protein
VIPCFEPVITILAGVEAEEDSVIRGSKVFRPWMTPKRLTSMILWK